MVRKPPPKLLAAVALALSGLSAPGVAPLSRCVDRPAVVPVEPCPDTPNPPVPSSPRR